MQSLPGTQSDLKAKLDPQNKPRKDAAQQETTNELGESILGTPADLTTKKEKERKLKNEQLFVRGELPLDSSFDNGRMNRPGLSKLHVDMIKKTDQKKLLINEEIQTLIQQAHQPILELEKKIIA